MNPGEVERRILRPAVDRVSLIGELDLNAENSDGKSLSWWANDVVSRVGENAQRADNFKHFPAALAIWFTEHAQYPDSNAFWSTMPAWVKQGKLGPDYIEALQILKKNDFQAALVRSNRYVQAARIHALLPPFAIPDLFKKVRAAARNGWDAGDLRNHLLELTTTYAVSVRYLLEYASDEATDLLDRMIKSVLYPELAHEMLPAHIAAVAEGVAGARPPRETTLRQPRVHLYVLDYPELELLLPSVPGVEWSILEAEDSRLIHEPVVTAPVPPVIAQLGADEPYTLIPKDLPVLVFSNSGAYIKSGVLPKMGGMVVVDRRLKLVPDPYADLGRLKGAWGAYVAYVVAGRNYELLDEDNSLRATVSSRSDIYVQESVEPLLRFRHSQRVYSEVPKLLADHVLVIDNVDGSAVQRMAGDYVVSEAHEPHVSLSLKGERLGDSYDIEGLIMPGVQLQAPTTTLIPGKSIAVDIKLPIGWNGPDKVELLHGNEFVLAVSDVAGRNFELSIEIPSLSWALNDRREDTPQWTAETLTGQHTDLTFFDAVRVYHGELTPPRVMAFSGGRLLQQLVPANQGRTGLSSSHVYDLRSLHGLVCTNAHETVEVRAVVANEEIVLIRLSTKVKKSEWKAVSLQELASQAGYSEDEMRAARRENYELEAIERKERDRRLTEDLRRRSRGL